LAQERSHAENLGAQELDQRAKGHVDRCVAHRWYALPIARPEMPHLHAWYQRLTERPGFAQNVTLPLT
jgi:glutathione S-transferase